MTEAHLSGPELKLRTAGYSASKLPAMLPSAVVRLPIGMGLRKPFVQ